MRTKTTLAAAAILAAGLASSLAQNVYSLNVVGYYTKDLTGALTPMCNSLRAAAGTPEQDRLDKVIPYADGDNVQVWTGTSWATWTMDSLSSTGWYNPAAGEAPLNTLPVIGPGVAFFYGANIGTTSVTFVGEVRGGTTTVPITAALTPVGSPLPLAGLVTASPVSCPVQDGDNIQLWTGTSWATYTHDSLSSTGWYGPTAAEVSEPSLTVGQGFFYGNNVGPVNWVQTYP
jgi:hypothetical protein